MSVSMLTRLLYALTSLAQCVGECGWNSMMVTTKKINNIILSLDCRSDGEMADENSFDNVMSLAK